MYNRIAFLVIATILLTAIVSIALFNSKAANAQSSSQNKTGMMSANLTSSIPLNPSQSPKAIISQVHVSLVNASTTAEKSVGTNAHSIAVRLGTVNGHLVYSAVVYDMNTGTFHGVLVDPGNGKLLVSTQIPTMAPGMTENGSSHP
jgi:hypothetical protein